MKRWFPVLVLGAMLAVGLATPLQAQQAPTQQAFSLSAANQASAVIQFSSPISSCGVVVYNGGTFTLVPQSSNDGQTWVTASGINSGSISATGSYTGGVANTGLKSFRVLLTAVDSTAVTGIIACSGAIARSGGSGPTPTPFVPSTPAAGNCIAISTPPAAGTIAYNCATPGPQATPSPTGAGNIVWSGSWPYTSTVATPSPSATGCGTITGSFPYTINTTTCGGGTPAPNVLLKSSTSTWDSVACGETSVRHCYPMNDAAGCNSIADTPTGTAAPSPVPLPTPTTASTITCGAPSISNDGETSIQFNGAAASSYLRIPAGVMPVSGSWWIEVVYVDTGSLWAANTDEFVFDIDSSSSPNFEYATTGNSGCSWPCDIMFFNGANVRNYAMQSSNRAADYLFTYNGTTINAYINCNLVSTASEAGVYGNGTQGYLGIANGNSDPFIGRIAKFAIGNTALSATAACLHTAALGL